uniref:ATP-dependent RNA helicase n=1 Tax=Phallusia mammillata TaxID=59560 RepID=A0A6F9DBJ1_9ASCI|nr:ATP-dependent RNA helicase ddx24 [Phallusia mammillata]
MLGGQVKSIVANQNWESIPLVVGGRDTPAPKFKDLIAFEELTDYSLVGEKQETKEKDITTSKKQSVANKKRKKDRQAKQKALKRKLFLNELENKTKCDAILTSNTNKKQKLVENVHATCNNKQIVENVLEPVDTAAWNSLFVPEPILKSLSELGFSKPMPIQEQTLPVAIRDKRDILGAAETGSGKTLAFGIPLLHHLMEDKERNLLPSTAKDLPGTVVEEPSSDFEDDDPTPDDEKSNDNSAARKVLPALILTPTRELAIQVKSHLMKISKYAGLWVVSVVGGMASQKQTRLLSKGPDVVVATPGRLWELMDSGHPYLAHLHKLRYLVIDEADRMLERGHFEDLTRLLDAIKRRGADKKRQTYIFSATLTTVHQGPSRKNVKGVSEGPTKSAKLDKLVKRIGMRQKPHVVDLTTNKVTAEKLSEAKIICHVSEKDFYLYYFLKSYTGRTLIFTNSIDCIFRLSGILEVLGCRPLHIHAKMQQRQRLKHLERFQADNMSVMIASDVAARGLDIPDVKHVIHYQVPRTMETYIHRSGRSARSGKDGLSLMFVSAEEMVFYKRVCRSLKKDDGMPLFLVNQNYMAAVRKRVNIARDIDKMSHKIKKTNLHNDWFIKNAEAMEMALDEDMLIKNDDDDELKQVISSKKQQLAALLKKPIFPKGFSGKFITQTGELSLPGIKTENVFNNRKKESRKRRN